MNAFDGLSVVNVELTSRCNKKCWMCGRRKLEKNHPELCHWGDMQFFTAKLIASQLPSGIIVQFHNNGEPLLYDKLGQILSLFQRQIRCFNTNGILLLEKADSIIGLMEVLTISVIERERKKDNQYETVKKFIKIKGDRPPRIVYRLLGEVSDPERWYDLPGTVVTRVLHHPMGSFQYTKKVTIPEHGICLDLLSHLLIDRFGDVYPCVRFNPHKKNMLGNVMNQHLSTMWDGEKRKWMIKLHIKGMRDKVDLCKKCDFYGCPISY